VKRDFFIGLDGGGTKTKLILEDAEGKRLADSIGGPANIRLSVEKAWQSIHGALESALQKAKLSLDDPDIRYHAGLGLAGTEIRAACQSFLARPHPFATLALESDAYVACLGAHEGKDGAIIIVGTGVVGYQIEKGRKTKVGGWGFPHSDEGGGAWLGMEAVRHTLQWLDGRIAKSELLEEIYAHFDRDLEKLVIWANEANASYFAQMAPLVIKHLQAKDTWSVALLKMAVREIEEIDQALVCASTQKNFCCLFGGIAPYVQPYVCRSLRKRIIPRKHDAAKGALFMIRNQVLGRPL